MSGNNKWTSDAERDLAMAIILSHGPIKHDWPSVAEKMSSWGYGFTIGSMSQHWTKKIYKDFKNRRADGGNGDDPKTPKKSGKAAAKSTPKTSSTGKRKLKKEDLEDSDDETPSKKNKAFVKKEVADENLRRSVTSEAAFYTADEYP